MDSDRACALGMRSLVTVLALTIIDAARSLIARKLKRQ